MDKSPRRVRPLGWLLASLTLIGLTVATTGTVGAQDGPGERGRPDWANGNAAIARLGDRLPDTAQANGLTAATLRQMFMTDATLYADDNAELLYVEPAVPGETAEALSSVPASAPPTDDPVFQMESRPGADHTIYLDFDGHVTEGTSWNGSVPTIVSPAYDTNGDPDTWSAAELDVIRASFEAVAEDFAPFDVNVTTSEPAPGDLRFDGTGDARWGTRVVITRDTDLSCGCGGIAYIGSFDDRTDEPVFVFNTSRTGVIEAISHEVGHALLLSHDGQQDVSTYYRGHGSGEQSWGPIMGAAYNRTVTQWSAGAYHNANNIGADANYGNGENDLAVIGSLTNGNGFGWVDDDHGDDGATATTTGTARLSGTISTSSDVDAFLVQTTGGVRAVVTTHPSNPNLDPSLTLTMLDGTVIEVADDPATLTASIDRPDLAAGSYLLLVDGVGWGTPLASSPSGWTDDGSLGNYEIDIVVTDGPPDVDPPQPPTGLVAENVAADSVDLSWVANNEADLASYRIERSAGGGEWTEAATVGAATTSYTDTTVAPGSGYRYRLVAVDAAGNASDPSAVITVTTLDAPVTPDVAFGERTVAGTVSGTFAATAVADGVVQTLQEATSGGRPSRRYDQVDHRWEIAATDGNHVLVMDASVTAGTDADDGFVVSWSSSPDGPWTVLGVLTSSQGSLSADLGASPARVHVRVVDTNRTAGNTSADRLAVDLLKLDGGGPPTDVPDRVTTPSPADGATGLPTVLTLAWSPADGAARYRVTFAGDNPVGPIETVQNSVTISGLASGVTYRWQVEAINSLGSSYSDVFGFTTAPPATSASVDELTTSTASARRGTSRVVAEAVVIDDTGLPVAGATVSIRVSGSIEETMTGVTDAFGRVELTSVGTAKKPSVTVCVASLDASPLGTSPGRFDC